VGDVVVAVLGILGPELALWREWPPEWTPFVVRAALLVSAALATAAATFRALPRTGPALALFGCAVALAAFGLGAALPVHPWWKGICFLHGAASLGKLLALGRPRGTTPGFVRGAAFVLLWPDRSRRGVRRALRPTAARACARCRGRPRGGPRVRGGGSPARVGRVRHGRALPSWRAPRPSCR
jgi:hypothetical protein